MNLDAYSKTSNSSKLSCVELVLNSKIISESMTIFTNMFSQGICELNL